MEDPDRWHGMFVQCMHALFEANGQPAPELKHDDDAADAVGFAVDGIDFEISHDAARHRDHLLLECEFGPAPEDEWGLRALLRLNCRLQASGSGSFGWRPGVNAITFGVQVPMAQCGKDAIEAVMAALAQQVHHWRAGRSLYEEAFPVLEATGRDESPRSSETDARAQLVRVLQELCEDDRVDRVEELAAAPQTLALRFSMGDAEVVLVHAEPRSTRLTLECEYGAAPVKEPMEILMGLLKATDADATGGADGFGLAEPADLVMFRRTIIGPVWTSEQLLDGIVEIGRNATQWFEACWGQPNRARNLSWPIDEFVDVLN
ncbi:CesT family type III secretion system chaperone [Rhizobacter sp. SG703]|uniref:CesT family type III secretion system chaperone n=1 Tax=Rhizobacter sp. SG703 TaxID=2587140 RepID=UPI00144573A7|nr:CesT family type III secretion system chaperone [Rhizobacter sp. SG703]NKI93334.1 hypothetical protein [Rhizobacter sp. SG703]